MTATTSHPRSATGVDLHTHSTASDGLLSPAELVVEASQRGIVSLALTDHDTIAGLPEAAATALDLGIELIPGVELSAESNGHEIHILGYDVPAVDPDLQAALSDFARQRDARAARIVEQLCELGLRISIERVKEIATGGIIGRPHIARALIEAGHVSSVAAAFEHYLGVGKPAYVPRAKWLPEQSVALVRDAGAIPVLAHPFSTGDVESTLKLLVPHGLLGIEVYYGEYSAQQHRELRALAGTWALIPTGGSDYHGPNFKADRELGLAPVPKESVQLLRNRFRLR